MAKCGSLTSMPGESSCIFEETFTTRMGCPWLLCVAVMPLPRSTMSYTEEVTVQIPKDAAALLSVKLLAAAVEEHHQICHGTCTEQLRTSMSLQALTTFAVRCMDGSSSIVRRKGPR